MINNSILPQIINSTGFTDSSFSIEHVSSSLKLSLDLQQKVDENWKDFKRNSEKTGEKVWDGTYYRLENIQEIKEGKNILKLSTIKYSQIRGLTHNLVSILPKKAIPYHISTGALIKTSDNMFIFGERRHTSFRSSNIDYIGGGLQPEEVEVNLGCDIFENVVKEISEEAGISRNCIESLTGIGIVLSSKYNVIFLFYAKLKIDRKEVLELFAKNNDDEMSNLVFVKESELSQFLSDKGSYRPLGGELYFKNIPSPLSYL